MNRLRKDVSDAEIATHMAPRVLELMRSVVQRIVRKAPEPKADEIAPKRDVRGNGKLSALEVEYLESIVAEPRLSVTARRDHLALSTWQNNEVKRSLLEKGLIEEFSVNLGKVTGGIMKLQELTEEGFRALGMKPKRSRPQNVSAEHWFWQKEIAAFYQSSGTQAEIEMHVNGVFADVGLVKHGRKIAIEVGITPKNEVANVQRDLAAGFDEVIVAGRNMRVLKAIEERLWPVLAPELHDRVKLILLSDFPFVRELLKRVVQRAVQRS